MRFLIACLLLLNIFLPSSSGQDKKTFRTQFLDAEYFFYLGEYDEARFIYSELLKQDPTNANLQFLTGACYLSSGHERTKAIPYLEKAVKSMSPGYREGSYKERNAPSECLFALARAYHINNQLDLAQVYYEKYHDIMKLRDPAEIEFVLKHIESCKLAEEMLNEPMPYTRTPFSAEMNRDISNYNAVFATADSIMVYTRQKLFYTAIMMTRMINGSWSEPLVINDQLEADDQVVVTSISQDGKELYLVKPEDNQGDIYISHLKKGKWSRMEKLPEPLNTPYNESHAAISADGRTLFISSDRPGGLGALDIWIAKKNTNGEWERPVNAGKPVNTLYSEDTPFLTNNGKLLFFSSMGHPGMGGFDVFHSSFLPSGTWSYPANPGYPINTCNDDLFFFPMGEGLQALYSGFMSGGEENRKIYLVHLDEGSIPENIALRGIIKLGDNVQKLDETFTVQISSKSSPDTVIEVLPDPETGVYEVDLKPGSYEIQTEGKGYTTEKESVTILEGISRNDIRVETELTPEKVSSGEFLVIRNILFEFNEYTLNDKARIEVEKLFRAMQLHPKIYVQVTGHADAIGSREYNLELSVKRARSVVEYLVAKGISPERFISLGAGEQENIAVNRNPDGTDNPEGRRLNRYAEISLINHSGQDIRIESIEVPKHLRPTEDLSYTVLLRQTMDTTYIPPELEGRRILLTETDKARLYFTETYSSRPEAVLSLNHAIDNGYPEAILLTSVAKDEMVKSLSDSKEENNGPFTIQILALKKPADLSRLSALSDVSEILCEDGYYRYITGIFESKDKAAEELQKKYTARHPDAFIVSLEKYQPRQDHEEVPDGIYYTIQFSATRKPADRNTYRDIGRIRVSLGSDGFYRYSTGIYTARHDAEVEMERIRSLGYGDAFLRKIKSPL